MTQAHSLITFAIIPRINNATWSIFSGRTRAGLSSKLCYVTNKTDDVLHKHRDNSYSDETTEVRCHSCYFIWWKRTYGKVHASSIIKICWLVSFGVITKLVYTDTKGREQCSSIALVVSYLLFHIRHWKVTRMLQA